MNTVTDSEHLSIVICTMHKYRELRDGPSVIAEVEQSSHKRLLLLNLRSVP